MTPQGSPAAANPYAFYTSFLPSNLAYMQSPIAMGPYEIAPAVGHALPPLPTQGAPLSSDHGKDDGKDGGKQRAPPPK
jgi:hypothetical protein